MVWKSAIQGNRYTSKEERQDGSYITTRTRGRPKHTLIEVVKKDIIFACTTKD